MARRTRKPPIRAEQRREWLKRLEEGGESPPQIAEKDHFDLRTVRKQIGIAKQEREEREAKVFILRNAMELHYSDMRQFLERLNLKISGKDTVSEADDEFIEKALRQHIPRSPIWVYLKKMETLQSKSDEQIKQIQGLMERSANDDGRLNPLINAGLTEVVPVFAKNLAAQVIPWLDGATELHLINNLRLNNAPDGLREFHINKDVIGRTGREHADEYKGILFNVYNDMESMLKESTDDHAFERTHGDIKSLITKLREELAILRLKRIVPGHCDYCPM
jgi:flagellar biosynthesis chaperone FliJ